MEKIWFLFSALILGVLGGTPCQKEGVTSAPGRCSYYHVCQNGTLSVEKCSFAHRFDPVTKSCVWYWKVNCTDWAGECEDGNLYNHPESCRAYYSCFDRRLRTEFCPFLYTFDGQKCSFMSSCNKSECKEGETRAVDCSSYDVCHNGKWTRKGCGLGRSFDIKEKRCVFGGCGQCTNGDKEMVDGACHRYKECVNGEYVEKSCGLAKMFNSTTQTCEWFFHVDCAPQNKMCSGNYALCGDKNCVSYHTCTNGKLETNKCGIFRRFELSKNTCVFNFFTNLAETGECRSGNLQPDADCRKFQKCVKGQWVVENCPEGQAFDYRTNMCQFEDSVQCSETSCINGQKYIMKNDCYKYYECINNQKVVKDCYAWYSWKYFNPETKECTQFWKSFDCSTLWCKNGEKRATSNKYVYEMCMDGEWVRQECLDGFDPIKKECPDWTKNMLLVLTSLNTKCVAGTKLSIDGYCRKYKQCNKNGEYVVRQCSKNTVFDPTSMKCREDIKCPVYTPLADRCDEFLVGDRVGKCLPGDKFDSKKLECVDHAMGHCLETNCDGVSKKNHEYDCSKYYQCENSVFVEKKCPWGKYYDAARQDCYLFGAKCAYDKSDCQSGYKKTVDCQKYAECKGDHYEINSCWWLRRFDMSKQQCGWKWNVQCNEMQILAQTCTEGEKEAVPNTCRYYKECEGNIWKTKRCSPCQNFNTDTKECDYVWKKPCAADITDPTLIPTDPTPSPTPPTTTPKKICNEGEKKGVKGDCKKYEECTNNAWVTSECFWFRKFDINSLRCVYTGATCA